MKENKLITPFEMGETTLRNRIVMAPLTRSRAGEGNVPTSLNAEYYEQRASAGLIITEATQVSESAQGYPFTPGIHSSEQIEGWKKTTEAVHKKGGKIFVQLWHVGRISHPVYHNGELPVAPSPIKPEGQAFTFEGFKDFVTPIALEIDEIRTIVKDFQLAAKNALEAGFDGIEIHAANGYLIDQFLEDVSNKREDEYGDSFENRARFLFEILDAVFEVIPASKVGIRLSPSGVYNTMGDSNAKELFTYVIEKLNPLNLAYLHLVGPMAPIDDYPQLVKNVGEFYAPLYKGNKMLNGGFNAQSGHKAIDSGLANLVSFGRLFIANPDLPERFKLGLGLNEPDEQTFYGGNEKGYTDYPSYKLEEA